MNVVIDECVQIYQPKKDGAKGVKAPEDLGRILLKGESTALCILSMLLVTPTRGPWDTRESG